MSLTHSTAAKNAATDAVVNLLDVGAGANGTLEMLDGATVISEHDLSDPAFGSASAGVATAASIANAAAGNTGTIDGSQLKDKDGSVVFSGTAGVKHAVTGVNTGNKTFTVAGDLSGISLGQRIRITDSTGNDGTYTLCSITGSGPTTLTMIETVPSATADGNLHAYDFTVDNTNVNAGQTVAVSSLTYEGEPS